MQLRSGYKTPPELGDWKYDPDEYDSDFDSKETCNTTKGKGAPASSRDAGASQAQACTEQVPYWVPATLPSCVPGPRHNQQVQPSSSSSSSSFQNDNSNISRNNNSQNACEVQFPLTLSTPSNNLNSLPQPWPLMNGSSIPFPGNNQNVAFPNSLAMRSTGPHLPLQPLGGGAASFFNFDFQTPFPMLFPDIGLGMDLGMGMGMGMGMNLAMDPAAFPLPGDALMPMNVGLDINNGNGNPHGNGNTNGNTNFNSIIEIPLKCYLCPGTPIFSDISHLLTHISSKSHLAVRFRIGLSDSEQDKQRIVQFDNWAAQYGINQLLKNRQDAKDQKKQGQQQKKQRATGNQRKARRPAAIARVPPARPARDGVKTEAGDGFQDQMEYNPLALNQNSLNQNNWHRHTPRDTSLDDVYQTPSNNRARSIYPPPDSPLVPVPQNNDVSPGGSGEKTLRLKGAIYPGMDLFDSATLAGQKTRNQRKHVSVLHKMVLTSQSIQRDEWQWDDKMSMIKRKKDVYDSPSDLEGSPGSKDGEDEQLKKRARRAAPTSAKTERQTRTTTRSSKAGSKRRAGKKVPKIEEASDSDEEVIKPRGRRGLDVFDDDAGHDLLGGDVFGGRRQAAQDMTGSPFGGQQSSIPYRNAMQGLPSNRPMTSMFGRPDNQRTFGWLDKDGRSIASAFSSQQPSPNDIASFYSQLRQNAPTGGLNPLCVQRPDNSAYLYGQAFDTSRSATAASFPTIHGMVYNGMSNGMGNGMSNGMGNGMNSDLDNNSYSLQSDNGSGQNNNFDI